MTDCCSAPGSMPLDEALRLLFENIKQVNETEEVSLEDGLGRILASPVTSPMNIPPHNNSAMDGYAVSLTDLKHADTLPLAGQSLAGHPYEDCLPKGHCVRIMTGACVPVGADVVIMQEQTEITPQGIRFLSQDCQQGQNIRCAGEDITEGQPVLSVGGNIQPQDIGLLASLGISSVSVFRRLRVAVFSTGDELKLPGEVLGKGDIYDSNRFVVKAMLSKLPVDVIDLGRLPDDKEQLRQAFMKADQQADAIITSGGVSVGDADYIKDIMAELGEVGFWKVAIKPGKPFAFGQLPNSYFFGLPGNPVSATVTFQQLAAPALRHMINQLPPKKVELSLKTKTALKKRPGRRDFQRGALVVNASGVLEVESTGQQGSGILSSLSDSDCFIVLPEASGDVNAGEYVTVQLFDELLS